MIRIELSLTNGSEHQIYFENANVGYDQFQGFMKTWSEMKPSQKLKYTFVSEFGIVLVRIEEVLSACFVNLDEEKAAMEAREEDDTYERYTTIGSA